MLRDSKQMWRVEKFTPTHCPHCNVEFDKEGTDWYRIIYDDQHRIIQTEGYYLCRCIHCVKTFQMVPTESWQVTDEAEADRLCQEEGFLNKIPCVATGTMTRDSHTVNVPGTLRVVGLKCDEGEENATGN